ncbi:hypothetical protein F5Y05DRAFT_352461 [Hypoxylon sp. FL0543]|nr:hypothetical protein F5Y05DRAFT_352461 [Hypoxylon sp. FL0543]
MVRLHRKGVEAPCTVCIVMAIIVELVSSVSVHHSPVIPLLNAEKGDLCTMCPSLRFLPYSRYLFMGYPSLMLKQKHP